MPQVERTVQCPLPGLETVRVVYNLMATGEQADRFIASLGDEERDTVVVAVQGWPSERFGEEMFGNGVPLAFRMWVARQGLQQAISEFVNDPL